MRLTQSRIRPGLAAFVCAFLFSGAAASQSPAPPAALPSRFEAHRIYLHPVTETGDTLRFFTDTGGGMFLLRPAVERLGLVVTRQGDGENPLDLVDLPTFRPEASIPGSPTREGRLPVWSPPPGQGKVAGVDFDGMLGQEWFGGRAWTFDYPGKRLLLRAAGDVPASPPEHRVAVTFKNDEAGARLLNFPRIEAMIDGDTLSLLFDTGASTFLSDSARTVLGDGGPAARATCFITTSRFEAWRERHPEWRVIERAESTTGEAMIEVPELFIAGHRVDGVWFTRRPDRNFHEYMSGFMDARVEGALGGNALRDFRVTVDYPNGVAVVER